MAKDKDPYPKERLAVEAGVIRRLHIDREQWPLAIENLSLWVVATRHAEEFERIKAELTALLEEDEANG